VIGRLSGREDFEPQAAPHREGEVERTALDPSLSARELGWSAQHEIERGIELTLETY